MAERRLNPMRLARRAFTLVELIVVIAIIIILAAILVPVATTLLGGRSIAMARNVMDGYFGGVRLEAVNRGKPILVALLPSLDRNSGNPWRIQVSTTGGSSQATEFGHGFVAFRVDTTTEGSQQISLTERIQYIGRDLIFESKFRGNIGIHQAKQAEWASLQVRLPPRVRGVSAADLKMLGIPDSALLIYVNENGSAWIPNDRAGYEVDSVKPDLVDGDIVLTSRNQVGFYDINAVLKVRGRLFTWDEIKENQKYYVAPENRESRN
jgi:prepilin-type N-terminal cleavage/methylation domain-containing protein